MISIENFKVKLAAITIDGDVPMTLSVGLGPIEKRAVYQGPEVTPRFLAIQKAFNLLEASKTMPLD
jgi:hypothetical protein